MEALRIITKPINHQLVIDLPPSLSSEQQYEVIILTIPCQQTVTTPRRRQPSSKLAGTVRILDDLTTPATPESDWQLS